MKIGQKLSNEKIKDEIVSMLVDRFRNPHNQLNLNKLYELRKQSSYTVDEFAVVYRDMLDYALKFYFGRGL